MAVSRLSIAFLLESTVLCGGVKVVLNLAASLNQRGHEVEIISSDRQPDWFKRKVAFTSSDPFKCTGARFDRVVSTTYRLAAAHFRHNESGRHWHLVQGFEGGLSECRQMLPEIDMAYRLPIPRITVSQNLAEKLALRYPQNLFVPIGQGLETNFFYPPQEWRQKARHTPEFLFLVGPLRISVKQVESGLKAFGKARKKHPGLKLIRISPVDTRQQEEKIAGKINEYYVHIHPEKIGELFRTRNALLLAPSGPGEGFGLPPLEAMACALPAVVSDTPGFRSFGEPADYARFVKHNDYHDMAAGVCELLSDVDKREYYALRGPQVAGGYSFESMADKFEKILHEYSREKSAVGNHSGGPRW